MPVPVSVNNPEPKLILRLLLLSDKKLVQVMLKLFKFNVPELNVIAPVVIIELPKVQEPLTPVKLIGDDVKLVPLVFIELVPEPGKVKPNPPPVQTVPVIKDKLPATFTTPNCVKVTVPAVTNRSKQLTPPAAIVTVYVAG